MGTNRTCLKEKIIHYFKAGDGGRGEQGRCFQGFTDSCTEQPEINRLKVMCSFSKKDTHIQGALLMSVLRAKADSVFNLVFFSNFKSEICNLVTSLLDTNHWTK